MLSIADCAFKFLGSNKLAFRCNREICLCTSCSCKAMAGLHLAIPNSGNTPKQSVQLVALLANE